MWPELRSAVEIWSCTLLFSANLSRLCRSHRWWFVGQTHRLSVQWVLSAHMHYKNEVDQSWCSEAEALRVWESESVNLNVVTWLRWIPWTNELDDNRTLTWFIFPWIILTIAHNDCQNTTLRDACRDGSFIGWMNKSSSLNRLQPSAGQDAWWYQHHPYTWIRCLHQSPGREEEDMIQQKETSSARSTTGIVWGLQMKDMVRSKPAEQSCKQSRSGYTQWGLWHCLISDRSFKLCRCWK